MNHNTDKLLSIQGLRGISIIMIFLSHTQIFLYDDCSLFSNWGRYGVYVFISISGVLTAHYCDKYEYTGTLKEGFRLMQRKIKKLYWLHLLMWVISVGMVIKNMSLIRIAMYSVFNLTLTQSYIPFSGIINSFNGPSWYLSMSTFLWIMTPIVVVQYKKRCKGKELASAIVVFIVIIVWLFIANGIMLLINDRLTYVNPSWVKGWLTYNCPLLCFFYYILSFLIARYWKGDTICWCRALVYLASIFSIIYLVVKPELPIIIQPLINASTAIIVASAIKKDKSFLRKALLENRAITYVGDISSYIFLIHGVVNVALRNYAMRIGTPWLFVLSAVITLVLSSGAKWIYALYTKSIMRA